MLKTYSSIYSAPLVELIRTDGHGVQTKITLFEPSSDSSYDSGGSYGSSITMQLGYSSGSISGDFQTLIAGDFIFSSDGSSGYQITITPDPESATPTPTPTPSPTP